MKPIVPTAEELKEIAISALVEVAQDRGAPAAARAGAGRSLLEAVGAIGRNQDLSKLTSNRAMAEMSPQEIADEIARLSVKIPPPKMRKVKTT